MVHYATAIRVAAADTRDRRSERAVVTGSEGEAVGGEGVKKMVME